MRHSLRSIALLAVLAVLTAVASSCKDSSAPEKPGPAADIAISAGDAQTGTAGSVLPAPLATKVTDAKGRGVPNVEVIFQALSGSGTVTPTTARTNGAGVATTSWTLPNYAGAGYRVRAVLVDTLTGALVDSVGFGVTVVGGAPVTIYAGSAPAVGATGSAIPPLQVLLVDQYGNPSPNVRVTWAVTAGGGTVSPTASTTNASGVASTTLTLGNTVGTNTVVATAGSLTTGFSIQGRNLAPQLTATSGSAFGIARTSGGRFVVSLIHDGLVEAFDQASPNVKHDVATGGTPVVVATNAAGTYAYVSNLDGWLDIIDIGTYTVAGHVGIPGAHALALSPAGDRVYVTTTSGKVVAVSTATKAIIDSVAVPNGPWGIAFRTTGTDSLMYVTSRDGGTVTEVDTKTMSVLRTFTVGGRPHGLVISPDGSTLYAADNSAGSVKVISTTSGTVTGSVALPGAFGIAIAPDGSTLYVTTDNARAAVINTSALTITRVYDTGANARQVVSAPDGTTAWTANEGGWVDIIRR